MSDRHMPLKYLVTEVKRPNSDLRQRNLLSLSYGRVIRKDIDSNEGLLPASFAGYNVVRAGDIVMRLTDMQNDQRSLRTGLVQEPGIITSAYLTLRPAPLADSRYLAYWLYALDTTKQLYALGGGLRQSVTFEDLGSLPVQLPPLDEQRRIADFLDDQVARIDSIVAARRDQSDLLEEERIAGVARLIDQFPAQPLRRLVREAVVGIVVTPSAWYSDDGDGVPALRGTDVSEGAVAESGHVRLTPEGHRLHPRSRLRAGDVVVVRTGDAGSAAVVPAWAEDWNAIDLVIVRVSGGAVPEYVELVLNAARHGAAVGAASSGSIQQHFGVGALLSLPVPVPVVEQQMRVVEFVRQQRQSIAWARDALGRSAELLQEYKRSLITAAVTGQFDVSTASGWGVPA